VASRRIEKIFKADDLSGVGIAGAAGPAMEMAKLFQTELDTTRRSRATTSRSTARPTSSAR